jgi:hypothetical protein
MWTARRGEVEGRSAGGQAGVGRLGVAAVAILIFAVLPLHAQTENARAAAGSSAKTLADLPPAALPAISSVLGRNDVKYGMQETKDGYSAQNAANHLAAHYAANGVEIRSQSANWGFEFRGWGYGERPANKDDAAVAPSGNANRVEYRRGALTEWYVNGPLGIEQGFTISKPPVALPGSNQDALDIVLRLQGNLSASVDPGRHALVLRDRKGAQALRYGPLLAYDASGRELESWMEVQDGSLRLRVNTAGARYPILVDPWVQAAELTNASGLAGDGLGRAIAIDEAGDTVVVGAPYAAINGVSQGAAYVFVDGPNGWPTPGSYTAELINNNGVAGDNFGWSVAISGSTIVVGSPSATNMNEGAAYVFFEPTTGSGWVTPATLPTWNAELTPSTGVADGLFGYSVGISGNTVVVGAPQSNSGFGAAYVFVQSTPWSGSVTSNIELSASDGVAGDNFGNSVGINESENTIVAGAFDATVGNHTTQGAVYVFELTNGNGWETTSNFSAKLIASGGAPGDQLGYSVGINETGDTVVAGAPNVEIGSKVGQGAAYVFVEPTPGDWASEPSENQTAELTASSGAASTALGYSVRISGNTVVAGATGVTIGSNLAAGAAYVFDEPTAAGGWASAPSENETAELTATNGGPQSFLGLSVGISGNTVVAGAPGITFGSDSVPGAAYVFTQTGVGPTDVISATSGSGQTAGVNVAFSAPLLATVVNGSGTGVSGVTVTFTAPASGASGTFSGGVDTAVTDASGTATSGVFTANATAGSYSVTASAPNVTGTASFSLTNEAALTGTITNITSTSSKYQGIATLQAGFALVGNPVTVNFTVVPQAGGTGTPTGTVTVTDGSGDSCRNTVSAGSCALSFAQAGTFTFTATYVPDAASSALFTGSSFTYQNQETVLQLVVCGGFTTITGNHKTFRVEADVCVASDVNSNPTAQVLSCLQNATCNISITQTDPGVYSLELVVIIKNAGVIRVNPSPIARLSPVTLFWLGSLLATAMMLHLARRGRVQARRSWTVASLLIVMILLSALSACSTGPETPPGSYTVNVQFKDGNFNVVVPFPVVVQK